MAVPLTGEPQVNQRFLAYPTVATVLLSLDINQLQQIMAGIQEVLKLLNIEDQFSIRTAGCKAALVTYLDSTPPQKSNYCILVA